MTSKQIVSLIRHYNYNASRYDIHYLYVILNPKVGDYLHKSSLQHTNKIVINELPLGDTPVTMFDKIKRQYVLSIVFSTMDQLLDNLNGILARVNDDNGSIIGWRLYGVVFEDSCDLLRYGSIYDFCYIEYQRECTTSSGRTPQRADHVNCTKGCRDNSLDKYFNETPTANHSATIDDTPPNMIATKNNKEKYNHHDIVRNPLLHVPILWSFNVTTKTLMVTQRWYGPKMLTRLLGRIPEFKVCYYEYGSICNEEMDWIRAQLKINEVYNNENRNKILN